VLQQIIQVFKVLQEQQVRREFKAQQVFKELKVQQVLLALRVFLERKAQLVHKVRKELEHKEHKEHKALLVRRDHKDFRASKV
jgi:hypothetical protein